MFSQQPKLVVLGMALFLVKALSRPTFVVLDLW
jgi:hypothetical protein